MGDDLRNLVKELLQAIDDFENPFQMDYERDDAYYNIISLRDSIKSEMEKQDF